MTVKELIEQLEKMPNKNKRAEIFIQYDENGKGYGTTLKIEEVWDSSFPVVFIEIDKEELKDFIDCMKEPEEEEDMAKVTIKGINEDGSVESEVKSTPVLITELIGNLPGMCEYAITKALQEIRESAEMDERNRKMYAKLLKEKNEGN